jgi:predicted GNAT family acetyltransferase
MIFTRYQTAGAFLARAQAALEQHEAANNLMIGVAVRLAEHPDRIKTPPYLATVEAGGELLAAAVMTPPHRVIIHGESADSAPLKLIVQDLLANDWTPPGTIGPSDVARAFSSVWTASAGGAFQRVRHERVYELRQVIHPTGVPGALRVATEADRPLVADWMYAFTVEAGLGGTPESAAETTAQRIDARDIFLWEVSPGQPVSLAGKPRHSTHGVAIGPVYTPPAFRRRGYAGACVAALSQQMLDAGWQFCALFTDLANPTSNSVYQKIGYRPLGDFDEYDFS